MQDLAVGPRVSVDRDSTADRGGGQLVLKPDGLFVRTRGFERLLGGLTAIERVELVDLARARARVCLSDGRIWNVQSEQGEDLTSFFRQLESASGRPELVRDPPRISEMMRAAATPARTRTAAWIALALLAFLPLRWLGALARPLGMTLAVLGAIALLCGGAAYALRNTDAPRLLRRIRRWVSWPALTAALITVLAGAVGFSDATARAALEDAQARARAEAAQRAADATAREQAALQARRADAAALAGQLLQAMKSEHVREAKVLLDRIQALVPDHPTAEEVGPKLERALADLDERERTQGVARGIARARALDSDRFACESAKPVADTYALVRRARPSDENYDGARRALEQLEGCRKRVRARFAQGIEDARRGTRVLAATQLEAAIRRLGYPVKVTLSGRTGNVMRIEARELNAAAVDRILAVRDRSDATLETARTSEGFVRIELRGHKFAQDLKLQPVAANALVAPVLEPFGLAQPLTLDTSAP